MNAALRQAAAAGLELSFATDSAVAFAAVVAVAISAFGI